MDPSPLMLQNEDTFTVINVVKLERKYWSKLKQGKGIKCSLITPKRLPPKQLFGSSIVEALASTLSATGSSGAISSTTNIQIATINPVTPTVFSNIKLDQITPHLVKISQFIKYTKMTLTAENDILQFYQNLYAQAMRFNIIFIPCGDISTTSEVTYPDLLEATQTVINTALGATFREEGTTDK